MLDLRLGSLRMYSVSFRPLLLYLRIPGFQMPRLSFSRFLHVVFSCKIIEGRLVLLLGRCRVIVRDPSDEKKYLKENQKHPRQNQYLNMFNAIFLCSGGVYDSPAATDFYVRQFGFMFGGGAGERGSGVLGLKAMQVR